MRGRQRAPPSAAQAITALPANAIEYRFEILGARKERPWIGARASGRVRYGSIFVLWSRTRRDPMPIVCV